MIGIRADANRIIATGHVMRCITVAKELTALGESVTFFVADDESRSFLERAMGKLNGLETVVLGSSYDHMEEELSVLEKEIVSKSVDVLLVDSYFVTPKFFQRISKVCAVVYMDDLGKEPYPVDLLINYSPYYKSIGYESLYKGMTGHKGLPTGFLLGLDYAPLRRQFYEEESEKKSGKTKDDSSKALKVLLAAGGGDIHGMLLSTLEAAAERGLVVALDEKKLSGDDSLPIEWEVVVGNFAADFEKIKALAEKYPGIHIHRGVANMADLMRSCDVAVTAAGTMITECAAVKLPAVFYQVADNQKPNADFWPTTGGMIFAGDVTARDESGALAKERVISVICDNVQTLSHDPAALSSMKYALDGLCDGRGAVRIAKELIKMI